MKAIIKKIFLNILTLAHLPITIIRVVVATTLLIDLWCDRIINHWLNDVEKELKADELNKKDLRSLIDSFYKWLDEMSESEYDNMTLTEKCERFFFGNTK